MSLRNATYEADRDQQIIEMRTKGMGIVAISRQLNDGTTPEDVGRIVTRFAKRAKDRAVELVDEMWWLGIERAEAVMLAVANALPAASVKEVAGLLAVGLRAQEQLAKQLGINKEARASTGWLGGEDQAQMAAMAAEFQIKIPERLKAPSVPPAPKD